MSAGPQPLARPLVRSAACAQLVSEAAQCHSSYYRVYSSEEDDSGDECASKGRLVAATTASATVGCSVATLLPSYSSVYSTIRQAATHQAQRQRDRQLELTHMSAVWEQHKRDGAVDECGAAKRAVISPAMRSTLSTASESSQLSSYSGDSGSGCDTDSDREASHRDVQRLEKQQQRRSSQQPQHFTFSVDDIDKALTEEELDEWFNTDDASQQRQGAQQEEEEDEDRSDEDELCQQRPQQQQQQRATLYTHVAVCSPIIVPISATSLSSSHPITPIQAYKPQLTINTVSTDSSADSGVESTISVLAVAAAAAGSSTSSSSAAPRACRYLRTSLPSTFTFSRADIRKSTDTASEELHVGHWNTFPRPSVPVCDVRALRGRLRERKEEWDRQVSADQLLVDQQQQQQQRAHRPCQAEEKLEAIRKPAAARRLFVESSGTGTVRARQSVVMWRRDSHTAQVAPLPVPSPPNDGRTGRAAQQIAQHRRAATAYSHSRISQAAAHRAHYQYESAALLHLHAQQQQQQRQQMIHAAYVSAANRSQHDHANQYHQQQHQPQPQHQPPAHLHHHTSTAHSDSTPAPYHMLPSQLKASPASDLFSPRTATKHTQWRGATYQPMQASYAVQPNLQHAAQPPPHHPPHLHSSYQPYDSRLSRQQHHNTGEYYNHYSPYVHDALHTLKPAERAYPAHGQSYDLWLTQQSNYHSQQTAAGPSLERCVSAAASNSQHSSTAVHNAPLRPRHPYSQQQPAPLRVAVQCVTAGCIATPSPCLV